MLQIPTGVSPNLITELESYQRQIKIFLRNHEILRQRCRFEERTSSGYFNSKDTRSQLLHLEKLIIQWNHKQKPVLDAIRKEILELKKKHIVKETPPLTFPKRKVGRRRKRRALKSSSRRTSPSPPVVYNTFDWSLISQEETPLPPGTFRAHISEYTKVTPESYVNLKEDKSSSEPYTPVEGLISNLNQSQFLLHLDLVTPSYSIEIAEKMHQFKMIKTHYRNLTYIPELSEKKPRYNFNYLVRDSTHPAPSLRTRTKTSNGLKDSNIRVTRSVSDSRVGRRKEESLTSSKRKHVELEPLERRVMELRAEITEFGPRTVATRKERSRRNEMIAEEENLTRQINQIMSKSIF